MCECLEYDDGSMHLCECCAGMYQEQNDALPRLKRIEAAARGLIDYEIAGAPYHDDWEAKFDKLKEALGDG